jgi:hypothetical protein
MKYFRALRVVDQAAKVFADLGLNLDDYFKSNDSARGARDLRMALAKRDPSLAPFVNDSAAFAREFRKAARLASTAGTNAGAEPKKIRAENVQIVAEIARLRAENVQVVAEIARKRAAIDQIRKDTAAAVRRAGEFEKVIARLVGCSVEHFRAMPQVEWSKKLDAKIEMNARELLAKHGINHGGTWPPKKSATHPTSAGEVEKQNSSQPPHPACPPKPAVRVVTWGEFSALSDMEKRLFWQNGGSIA